MKRIILVTFSIFSFYAYSANHSFDNFSHKYYVEQRQSFLDNKFQYKLDGFGVVIYNFIIKDNFNVFARAKISESPITVLSDTPKKLFVTSKSDYGLICEHFIGRGSYYVENSVKTTVIKSAPLRFKLSYIKITKGISKVSETYLKTRIIYSLKCSIPSI